MAARSHDSINATWTPVSRRASILHYQAIIKYFKSSGTLTSQNISSKGPFDVMFRRLLGYTQYHLEVRACFHNGECGDEAFIDVYTLPSRKFSFHLFSRNKGVTVC